MQINSNDALGRKVSKELPEVEPMRWPFGGEPRKYGANYMIAEQLGLRYVPRSFASWKHGWNNYAEEVIHPFQLVPANHSPDETTLLAHKDHANFLRESYGFSDVHVVGLPFIYTKDEEKERINDSILVMPPHTLPGSESSWDKKKYIKLILEYEKVYDNVVVSLHYKDVKKREWTRALEKKKISWVMGARVDDKNGLKRMRSLFSLFENMTTNTIGSHLPYASYCGCKVSINGPYFSLQDLNQDKRKISEYPQVVKVLSESSKKSIIKQKYPFLFKRPKNSSCYISWAKSELGYNHKVSVKKIADLLGWNVKDQVKGYVRKIKDKVL